MTSKPGAGGGEPPVAPPESAPAEDLAGGGAWSEELLYPDIHARYRMSRVLYDSATEHQRLVLFENPSLGRMLTLDAITQTTEKDEFIYHEMLAHAPIIAHGAATRVLIIGGGDGGIARRVLMHPGVARCVMVEIDGGVVEFSKKHLPTICGDAFDDPRLELVIADGAKYVAETDARFDVLITDSTDPFGPAEVLFTADYYASCKRVLSPGGVMTTQNGVPFFQPDELRRTARLMRPLFADVGCYLAAVPTYVGGFMALGWFSDDSSLRDVAVETLRARIAATGLQTGYYTADVHRAAFALPPYIGRLLEG